MMRLRLIVNVPGLDPGDSPVERFREFAADKNTEKPTSLKSVGGTRNNKREF
jgi:hypothetical protein